MDRAFDAGFFRDKTRFACGEDDRTSLLSECRPVARWPASPPGYIDRPLARKVCGKLRRIKGRGTQMKKGARVEGGVPLPPLDVDRSRLEFLFDGVFAIAMTYLVLALSRL